MAGGLHHASPVPTATRHGTGTPHVPFPGRCRHPSRAMPQRLGPAPGAVAAFRTAPTVPGAWPRPAGCATASRPALGLSARGNERQAARHQERPGKQASGSGSRPKRGGFPVRNAGNPRPNAIGGAPSRAPAPAPRSSARSNSSLPLGGIALCSCLRMKDIRWTRSVPAHRTARALNRIRRFRT